jgi:mono/diheme cytochrome c family protein
MWRRLLLGAALIGACACRNDWRTDMWYQPAVQPETEARPAPDHAVPLGAGPLVADRDEADSLRNPVPATPDSLARGQALFGERCRACHGEAGHGGGPVSKFFPAAPDLAYATVKARSDGYIYGTIAFGGKAMPSQGDGLTRQDRWDLANWVRHLQISAGGAG